MWGPVGSDSSIDRQRDAFIERRFQLHQGYTGRSHRIVHSGSNKNDLVIDSISDKDSSRIKTQWSLGLVAQKVDFLFDSDGTSIHSSR